LVLNLAEQAGVLNRDDRLVGEGLEERDLFLRKWPDVVAPDDNRTNALSFPNHRRNDSRLHAHCRSAQRDTGGHVRIVRDVRIMQNGAASDRTLSAALSLAERIAVDGFIELFPVRPMIGGHVDASVLAQKIDRNHLAG